MADETERKKSPTVIRPGEDFPIEHRFIIEGYGSGEINLLTTDVNHSLRVDDVDSLLKMSFQDIPSDEESSFKSVRIAVKIKPDVSVASPDLRIPKVRFRYEQDVKRGGKERKYKRPFIGILEEQDEGSGTGYIVTSWRDERWADCLHLEFDSENFDWRERIVFNVSLVEPSK